MARVATARATWPSGSSCVTDAMNGHGWPISAAVRGPMIARNSSESMVKRPSGSICQTKRSGWRRSSAGGKAAGAGGNGASSGNSSGCTGSAMSCATTSCAVDVVRNHVARNRLGRRRFDERRGGRGSRRRCGHRRRRCIGSGGGPAGRLAQRHEPHRRFVHAIGGDRRKVIGRSPVTDHAACRRRRADQHAVIAEHRDRIDIGGEQPRHAFLQRQMRAAGLGGGDQHGRCAVGERDARTGAGQHAPHRGAKAAQPLEPHSTIVAQRCGDARDFGGGGVRAIEGTDGERGRCRRVEHRGAGRVGPQQPRCIGRPQPCRRRAERQRSQARVVQPANHRPPLRRQGPGMQHP